MGAVSFCITAACEHGRGVFIWLGDGPWLGDPGDPDHGHLPWVHSTSTSPGHLEVCDRMPFATAEEAGEVCACSHESLRHPPSGPVPDAPAVAARVMPCLDCDCTDFRHRAEDLERYRAARAGGYGSAPAPAAAPAGDTAEQPEAGQLELFPAAGRAPRSPRRRESATRRTVAVPVAGDVV